MNDNDRQAGGPEDSERLNTARYTERAVRRGDPGHTRQAATQVFEVAAGRTTEQPRNLSMPGSTDSNSVVSDPLTSNRTTLSPRSYDPEGNPDTRREETTASRWLRETAERFTHTFQPGQTGPSQGPQNQWQAHLPTSLFPKDSQMNRSSQVRKNARRIAVTVGFVVLLSMAYAFSAKMVNYIDRRVARNINRMATVSPESQLNAVNQDLNKVIEELRMEIQKLKDQSYKNAVAINAISEGLYKVPGAGEETETAKRNKFGRGGNAVNLSSNVHRQDVKAAKRREDDAEFVPGSVEHEATVTLQS